MSEQLLVVENLRKEFKPQHRGSRGAAVKVAVNDVSFTLAGGETLALVGESGSGKSTLLNLVARLTDPTSGSVVLEGVELTERQGAGLREARREMQIVFQDPHTSLDPRMRVGQIIAEPLQIHGIGDRTSQRARVNELLELVGLDAGWGDRRPRALSGGQAQRVAIARALALNPKLLLMDEPTSALDLSVQAQVVLLLRRLQAELGLAYLFVTHNLAVVASLAQRVAVMNQGEIVELGSLDDVYLRPRHPYTKALLEATLDIPTQGAA
jgi:ABC-type glutathione transport system ATPase component